MKKSRLIDQMYSDFFNNKIPNRVPNPQTLPAYLIAGAAGISNFDVAFDYALIAPKALELARQIASDTVPVLPVSQISNRPAFFYGCLQARSFEMGSNGFMQHPENVAMMEDEYAQMIEDSLALMLDKIIPRQYKGLNPEDPIGLWKALSFAEDALSRDAAALLDVYFELLSDGNYYQGPPEGSCGFTEAPADFLADLCRGFKGFIIDIRRRKELVCEAAAKLVPYMFLAGLPDKPHPEGSVMFPFHMPSFMSPRDVEQIWLPSLLTVIKQYAALGVRSLMYLEGDWSAYTDYVLEFPSGSILGIEKGDPKFFKEKLGDKYILTGMFPVDNVNFLSKEKAVDSVHEFLDIVAPGGGYYFGFDKDPLVYSDVNWEVFTTVTKEIESYGHYGSEYGQNYGRKLNEEGYVYDETITALPPSRYSADWAEYKELHPYTPESARATFTGFEKKFIKKIIKLLM